MTSGGATERTSHTAAAVDGSFGGILNHFNSRLECVVLNVPLNSQAAVITRLDAYCRAVEQLGASFLSFDSCSRLEDTYNNCVYSWACPSCKTLLGVGTVSFVIDPSPFVID